MLRGSMGAKSTVAVMAIHVAILSIIATSLQRVTGCTIITLIYLQ